jgi:hypothetical protein
MFGAVDEDRTRLRQIDSLLYSQSTTTALFGTGERNRTSTDISPLTSKASAPTYYATPA